MSLCLLCETRKPRRFCPASRGDICSQCCGTEREQTVDCPLDCEYLIEAREHERPVERAQAELPHPDVRVTDQFLERNKELMAFTGMTLLQGAMTAQGATDADLREAIEAMIKTYRTLDSGLIYETRPANPYAEAIRQSTVASIDDLKRRLLEQTGVRTLRDNDILGVLVFFARYCMVLDNGRRRGKAMLSFLLDSFSEPSQPGPRLEAP